MIYRHRTACTNDKSLRRPRRRFAHGGLTLTELMLSMAGVGLIAIGISTMLTAVAYGTASSRDIRTMVVKNKALTNRIAAAIRGSKQILSVADDVIVLWSLDTNGDGLPSLDEVRLIELSGIGDLLSLTVDLSDLTDDEIDDGGGLLDLGDLEDVIDLDDGLDISLPLDTDFVGLIESIADADYLIESIWAQNIDSITLSTDTGSAATAKVVGFTITYTVGDLTDTAIGTASLRND